MSKNLYTWESKLIRPDKFNDVLFALQALLIETRGMSYKKEDYKKIASILEYAEELSRLIVFEEDQTTLFRDILVEITERYNSYFALQRFDRIWE